MAGALTALAIRPRQSKPPLLRVKAIAQRGEAPEILEVEASLDPLEILKAAGVGIVVGGVALISGWLLWDGLAAPTPFGPVQIFNGLKTSPWAADQAARLRGRVANRQVPVGFLTDEGTMATDQATIPCDQARVLYSGLSDFSRGFCRRNGLSSSECVEAWQELKARCDL